MSRLIDLTGRRFGKLVVLERSGSRSNNACWLCQCDCGNRKVVCGVELRRGEAKSCGCLQKETVRAVMTTHGHNKNKKRERLYGVWSGMLTRTRNPKSDNYKYYGGRGISVCEQWRDYEVFREWALRTGYDEAAKHGDCTLDRIDCNGDYCPENCRWVSHKEQVNNQRSNKMITYNGESHNLRQWADILNINYSTFKKYIHKQMSMDEIINRTTS